MRANAGPGRLLTASDVESLGLDAEEPPSPKCPHCGAPLEPLAVELLQKLVLEVGPCGCVRQVEDGRERRMVRNAGILSAEPVELTEKMLQAQVHANFLVAGKFVEDESCRVHSLFNLKEKEDPLRVRSAQPINLSRRAARGISRKF